MSQNKEASNTCIDKEKAIQNSRLGNYHIGEYLQLHQVGQIEYNFGNWPPLRFPEKYFCNASNTHLYDKFKIGRDLHV